MPDQTQTAQQSIVIIKLANEKAGETSVRRFLPSVPLVDRSYGGFYRDEHGEMITSDELPPDVERFVKRLFAIPGVVIAMIFPRSLNVIIGPETTWFKVEPQVIGVINHCLDWSGAVELTWETKQPGDID
jgi:hypothetical protein